MKIDILTVGGSPKDILPETLEGRGVGGAELALLTWAELMSRAGHNVSVYNQTKTNVGRDYNSSSLKYLPDSFYNPGEDRDILVTFRGPNELSKVSKYKKHIGWSCDQMTMGDYIDWYKSVDKMVLISKFHKRDHEFRYGKELVDSKAIVLDLGVRTWEYENYGKSKVPYQFIFCSVPDRGLNEVAQIWPDIKKMYPRANLIITSDYTLWGAPEPYNIQFKLKFAGMPGVKFVGNVPRHELVEYQQSSEIQLYPCIYDENFCIATAECQVAGNYCITSTRGALETTNFTGKQIVGKSLNEYAYAIHDFYNIDANTRLELSASIQNKAFGRFGWRTIADKWENIFSD